MRLSSTGGTSHHPWQLQPSVVHWLRLPLADEIECGHCRVHGNRELQNLREVAIAIDGVKSVIEGIKSQLALMTLVFAGFAAASVAAFGYFFVISVSNTTAIARLEAGQEAHTIRFDGIDKRLDGIDKDRRDRNRPKESMVSSGSRKKVRSDRRYHPDSESEGAAGAVARRPVPPRALVSRSFPHSKFYFCSLISTDRAPNLAGKSQPKRECSPMCGIVGLYLKTPTLKPKLGALFAPMLVEMSSRGPDSAGLPSIATRLRPARSSSPWRAMTQRSTGRRSRKASKRRLRARSRSSRSPAMRC